MNRKLALLLVIAITLAGFAACTNKIKVAVRAAELTFAHPLWPEQVQLAEAANALSWHLWQTTSTQSANLEAPTYCLQLELTDDTRHKLYLSHDLRLFNEGLDLEYLLPVEAQRQLSLSVEQLNSLRFGELLPWQEADRLLPRYSNLSLMDLETGIIWKAQRRAGSLHADIQPLTKQDTEQLKAAYSGTWSWDRRAVVILVGDRRIAASINGMPHGAGALNNGFPGHHCLHFWQSTTHTSNKPDPAHAVMVHKAAGRLHSYLQELPAADLELAMLEMVGQGEIDIIRLGIPHQPLGNDPARLASKIKNIKIWDSQQIETGDQRQVTKYQVSVYFQGDSREYKQSITVTSRYYEQLKRWLVDVDFILQLVR